MKNEQFFLVQRRLFSLLHFLNERRNGKKEEKKNKNK